ERALMFKQDLLKGKRILVTGGGTGLGREIAARYLALGAELWLAGRRGAVLEDTAQGLMKSFGGSVKTHSVDIRDAAAVDAMVQRIWDEGGPLTGLVNNAAGNFISPTQSLTTNGFNAIANIVFHGTFYVTHAVGKRWIAGGHKGSVISILVTWVWTGSPYVVPSAMSKAGIHIMTKSLAVGWGRHGLRLNAIAPRPRLDGHRARAVPDRRRPQAPAARRQLRGRHQEDPDASRRADARAAEPRHLPDGRGLRVPLGRDDRDRRRGLPRRRFVFLRG